MRGKFKKKQGKVTDVSIKTSKICIEGIQVKKQDGSKVNVKLRPSNLQIIELNLEDKKRLRLKKNKSQSNEEIKKDKSNEKTNEVKK